MGKQIQGVNDDISDNEILRRYFFSNHFDPITKEWSYNTFQLRDLKEPENFLSVTRQSISPDAVEHAKNSFSKNRLKRLLGFTLLNTGNVRAINIDNIELSVLSDAKSTNGHAGIYTWYGGELLEGSVEDPNIIRLKIALFNLAIPTLQFFPEHTFTEE